jgi:thiamine monophosphate kinase
VPCVAGVDRVEALASGEEYELLVALPANASVDHREFETRFAIPLTAVGVAEPEGHGAIQLRGARVDRARGHDHLS